MNSTQDSVWETVKFAYFRDNHPPGYYLLSRYTQFFFGSSDFALRLPSAVAGIMLVAATYIAGRKHFSPEAAIIAAALVAGSYQAIYYSQEARPNIFIALFGLLAMHYFRALALEGDESRKNYVMFWACAVLLSYFHYAGLVLCACFFLIYLLILVYKHSKAYLITGAKIFLPFAILYLPWVFGIYHHLVATPVTAWQRPPDIDTLKTTFWFLFGPDDTRVIFYKVVFLATLVLIFTSSRRWLLAYTMALIVLPVAIFFFKSSASQSAYNHRHFLYAIPLLALLAGNCLDAAIKFFPERTRVYIFSGTVIVILFYQYAANNSRALYTANHFKQEFRESAQVVVADTEFMNSATGIVVANTSFFNHYLKKYSAAQRESDFIYIRGDQMAELKALLDQHHASVLYYLEAPYFPGANGMITPEDQLFAESFQPLCRTRFARAQVIKYAVATPKLVDWPSLPSCRVPL